MRSPLAFASPRSEINVTPLVDVVLVLLIIFMVIAPFVGDPFYVGLPRTAPPTGVARHLVTVTLDAAGGVTLNGGPVRLRDLERKLGELFALGADRQVLFEAPESIDYREAADAMDRIRLAGGTVAVSF